MKHTYNFSISTATDRAEAAIQEQQRYGAMITKYVQHEERVSPMENQAFQRGDRVSVHAEYCGYDGESGTVTSTHGSTVFVILDEDEESRAGTAFATSEVKPLPDKA